MDGGSLVEVLRRLRFDDRGVSAIPECPKHYILGICIIQVAVIVGVEMFATEVTAGGDATSPPDREPVKAFCSSATSVPQLNPTSCFSTFFHIRETFCRQV